jgi:hypothetical protein
MALTIIPKRKPSIEQYSILLVGLDQHKEPIAVSLISRPRAPVNRSSYLFTPTMVILCFRNKKECQDARISNEGCARYSGVC